MLYDDFEKYIFKLLQYLPVVNELTESHELMLLDLSVPESRILQ